MQSLKEVARDQDEKLQSMRILGMNTIKIAPDRNVSFTLPGLSWFVTSHLSQSGESVVYCFTLRCSVKTLWW